MPTANSQRELATALNKSQPAINKWLKHPRWPFAKKPPWDVEKVRAWAAKTLGLNPGAPSVPVPRAAASPAARPLPGLQPDAAAIAELDPKLRMDLFLKSQRAAKIKFENELLQGKYLPRVQVEQDRLGRIHAVHAAHEQHLRRLAPLMVGMTEPEILKMLDAAIVAICHAFSRDPQAEAG